jgi:hypothetical protein
MSDGGVDRRDDDALNDLLEDLIDPAQSMAPWSSAVTGRRTVPRVRPRVRRPDGRESRPPRLQPVAVIAFTGFMGLCVLVMVACGYLLLLMAPFSPGLQTQEVGSPLIVHVLVIVILIVVTFHLKSGRSAVRPCP